MGVEMYYFSMKKGKDESISGMFKLLNYGNMLVTYEVKNRRVLFKLPYRLNDKVEEQYEIWYKKEQKIYEDFILVYLDEINKINTTKMSKGKIVDEVFLKETGNGMSVYEIDVEFDYFLKDAKFLFIPEIDRYEVEANLDIPINSKGKSNSIKIPLEHFITEETLKRLWEPFRTKTKYRLHLLFVLR